MLQGPPGTFQALQQPQITGKGFIVDQGAVRQQMGSAPGSGNGMLYVYETLVTPIEAGRLSLFAQGFISGNRLPGNIMITVPGMIMGGSPIILESSASDLVAKPLPHENELAGFTGAIGNLSIDPPTLDTNRVRAGEPVKLAVTVHADANLLRVMAPPPPTVRDWEIFAGNSNSPAPQTVMARHFFTFDYTLIPLSPELSATPPIPFSYFDPKEGKYKDLTIPGVPIKVESGEVSPDAAALAQTASIQGPAEPEPVLSALAALPGQHMRSLRPLQKTRWFLCAQFAPALFFLGLWKWEQRRRFLEQNPGVVLRRRARRALQQEKKKLNEAVKRQDGTAFAATAVRAMRIACAPHYPAEPKALVGSDVLKVLNGDTGSNSTTNVVREVFAAADAGEFSLNRKPADELLRLEPEFRDVLQTLEARL